MVKIMQTIKSIQKTLEPVFQQHHVKKATLFGSYAKGTADANSDIDLLVDSGLRGLQFFGLLEDVAVSFPQPVDLIDTSQVSDVSQVMMEIKKSGIVIYECPTAV